jgi:hypothetical protein
MRNGSTPPPLEDAAAALEEPTREEEAPPALEDGADTLDPDDALPADDGCASEDDGATDDDGASDEDPTEAEAAPEDALPLDPEGPEAELDDVGSRDDEDNAVVELALTRLDEDRPSDAEEDTPLVPCDNDDAPALLAPPLEDDVELLVESAGPVVVQPTPSRTKVRNGTRTWERTMARQSDAPHRCMQTRRVTLRRGASGGGDKSVGYVGRCPQPATTGGPLQRLALVPAVLAAVLAPGCDRNCFSGEEDVPDRLIQLDETVDARLVMCGGADDIWDITLDPGQYRLEVQSDHTSWAILYARDGAPPDTSQDQCGLGGSNANCQVEEERKTLTFAVAQSQTGHIHVHSRWFCETPVPDCPGHTYAYQLVVRRCPGNCVSTDAGP